MTQQTGGDLLAESLIAQGVDRIFGIPGVQLDAAADALHARADQIDFICARNEQATTYMADGYARSTGRVGVAMVVPGPGVLNALAGLATAYSANSPVLLIAGQIDSQAIGKGLGALHEIPDQTGVLERLTKWTGIARSADEIPGLVAEAFRQLRSGRPRPVALEVPPDVLAAFSDAAIAPYVEPAPQLPPAGDIARAAELLAEAKAPLIVVGGGVLASGASEELVALAERLEAPVLMTENGRGAIDARHRLAFDALALRELRERADLVLAVGTRFVSTFGTQVDVGDAQVILLNAEEADLHGPRAAAVRIHGDAKLGLAELLAAVPAGQAERRDEELDRTRAWVTERFDDISPQREYLEVIRAALPDNGVFVSEFTQVGYAASACYPAHDPRTYIGPGYQGTLGYGFATALGVKAADPERAVISVNGDGGFSWTLQELSTAKRYGLGLVTIVFHDGFYGNVRRIQKNRYGARFFASDLTNPDYQALAAAFGIRSAKAYSPAELAEILAEAVPANEPILIEVPVGEFPSPWHLIHEGIPSPAPLAPDAHVVPVQDRR
ncbi:thiamine pyrophosphate-binding protein [Leucobacter rhizosphaerae]|uniref:Thiamine pyrophosphate-binding protein n=1 Tax=Leucobacter rhizosphaerae TaxID=2932245 RepID=A0ABY4FTS2_9MICO|nr:thiamine pyrophosphate-dependent enzyme [Leucobacter rhizosphaerae]UOQ59574.1 thiamine pyrophosphate-binding protein [Leucobacter rhizosphaerae]